MFCHVAYKLVEIWRKKLTSMSIILKIKYLILMYENITFCKAHSRIIFLCCIAAFPTLHIIKMITMLEIDK